MTHDQSFASLSEVPFVANVSRRGALGVLSGLVLAVSVGCSRSEAKGYGADGMPHGWRDDPHVFVAIAEDGTVTITCHRSEMGQGVRTGWAIMIADELEADWDKVHIKQADGDEAIYGNQDTDGSRSTRHFFIPMRHAGAAMRLMLAQVAAAQWGVPVERCVAKGHAVTDTTTGKSLSYGALAKAASALAVPSPDQVKLKDAKDFRYIGKGQVGIVDARAITTGTAIYGMDHKIDGMLHAVVARPPVFGGTVKSYDDSEARKVPGVVAIVPIDPPQAPVKFQPLGGLAVVARNTFAAMKGRAALKITWDDGPNADYDSTAFRATLEAAARQPGKVVRTQGDVDAAMAKAAKRVVADYYIPHLVQAPMETPAAVADVKPDGTAEIWTCVQSPEAARTNVAERLGLSDHNVTVHVTLLGGGFGRKSKPDYVVEAALCSKAVGKPVKLVWTREDDIHDGFYHTVSAEHLEAGLDGNGMPIAWLHRSCAPTIGSIFAKGADHELPFELGMGLVNVPFAIPNIRIENPAAEAHARIGWFRSVSNIPHAFAIQSFVAELAHAAGRDPKDYLLDLIGPARLIDPTSIGDGWNHGEDPKLYPIDTARLRGVIETAAKASGWGRSLPKGHGLGLAGHYSFITYTAAVAEVAVDAQGAVNVERVDLAIDCGPQVNPERIRSQMEGAIVMGMGLALLSEITFKNGRVQQNNFDGYEIIRINATPKSVNVHLIPTEDYTRPLGGVGEPGVPPVAPAIANAVFAATGRRIRALPIRNQAANA
jgi:isoquinoline 1-oxidoreductase beta subunit